jgi:hypothetical protein
MSRMCIDSGTGTKDIRASNGIPDLAVPRDGFYKRD